MIIILLYLINEEGNMSFKAFEQGANVVSLIKGDSFYAMTCAWAMHIDYEEVLMLLGSQSDTSKNIEVGDKIGISPLSKGQKDIALAIGETHSLEKNKLNLAPFIDFEGVKVVKDAKNYILGEVVDILYPSKDCDDKLLRIKIVKYHVNDDKRFLSYEEIDE